MSKIRIHKVGREGKFPLGQIVFTPGAIALGERGINLANFLTRHSNGDWGDLDPFDKDQNDAAIRDGARLLSSYITREGKLWIITEWDRSVTTFLLPEEY